MPNRYSLADHLRAALIPCQIDALISPEALNRVEQIAARFPSVITDLFGFECRLGESAPGTDFVIAIFPTIGGRDVLLQEEPDRLSASTHPAYGIWSNILAFTRLWADNQTIFHKVIASMWLEFDLHSPLDDGTAPSILFLGPTSAAQARLRLSEGEHLQSSFCSWLPEMIKQLQGRSVSELICNRLLLLLKRLPSASICQIGTALSRSGDAIRLCIRGMQPEELVPFLLSLGWQGSVEKLNMVVENLPDVDFIHLDIAVADRVLEKIGIECYFSTHDQETAFINWLIQKNLCIIEKASALNSRWGGITHQLRHSKDWPAELIQRSLLKSPETYSCFCRHLHHVKLVVDSDLPLQAKAYLAVRLGFFTHAELKRSLQQLEERYF